MSEQVTLYSDFERVSPRGSQPEKRSRRKLSFENNYAYVKQLSETAQGWLLSHDESNWTDVELFQEYKKKGEMYRVRWKLPGTEEPKEYCGNFYSEGCFNVKKHPRKRIYIRSKKLSCFRSSCIKCWLEKWLARESSRSTKRIENYVELAQRNGFRNKKPIHVIVSPPWGEKYDRFDLLKEKCRKLMKEAGIIGGLLIYHPFRLDKETSNWVKHPHFHVIGFGWVVNTDKISSKEGWFIINKGVRDSLHSTIYYQLSHAGVSEKIHSVTWFGTLGYRSKYAKEIRVEKEELEQNCPFCDRVLVKAEYIGQDRPPPDFEFEALLNPNEWESLESVDEAYYRKNRHEKKKDDSGFTRNWINDECRIASEKADSYIKSLYN